MCGIAGFIGHGDQNDLQHMTSALTHRGPDDEGFHIDTEQGVYLGHRRLAIIDIKDGVQPMWNADESICVVFNGEIYNHVELRRELEAKGHRFTSDHSDTEVLIHGWKAWGEDLPLKLNAMFGFAIWDKTQKVLFLARDRFGEKPIYWAWQNETLLFGSELSAITAHSGFLRAFDPLALKKYFAHGFVPSPHAIYQDARKLPAGHALRFDLSSRQIETCSYWRFRIALKEKPPSLDEAAEQLRALMMQSIKRRLMSDVPLGVFLSGGIDSAFAAAGVCQFRDPEQVRTFSIGFIQKSFDESHHARTLADTIGTHHRERILDLDGARDLMDDVLGRLDEPLGDGSILPTALLCQFARTDVKVALSGDGGDELFAGYDPFAALKPAALYSEIMPRFAHKGMRRLADLLPKSAKNMSLDFKLRRVLQGLDFGPELWNPVWMAPLEPGDIADLFNDPVHVDDLYSEALALWHEDPNKNSIDKSLEYYTNLYLPDDILTKVDRAAMMQGLETRSIFLDNDVVNFARVLPSAYKFDGCNRKIILKEAARGLVPQSILDRPKKGFGIPLQSWLKDLNLSADGAERFTMAQAPVDACIGAHRSGREDHRLFLWCWAVLQRFGQTPD